MEEIFKHRMDIEKNILKSFQTDLEKSEENDIEKARHGVYADNPENRRLNRVGQEYGKKGEEKNNNETSTKNGDDKKNPQSKKSLEEHAKNTSDEVLKKVLANKNASEDLKNEAKNELAKRQGSPNAESNKKEGNSIKTFSEGSKFFEAYYEMVESDLDSEPYIKDINNYIDEHNLGLDDKNQESDFDKLSPSHKTALGNLMKKAKNEFAKKAKSNKKNPKIGEAHPNGKFVWGKLKSGKEDWVLKEGGADAKNAAVSSLKKMLEDESFASNFAEYERWGDEAEIDEEDKKEFEDIKKRYNWNYGKSFDWGEEDEAEMYKNKQKSKGFIVVDSGGGTDTYSFLLFKKK